MSRPKPYLVEIRVMPDEDDSRQAYNELYTVASLSQIESFYLWFRDHIELPHSGSLLDVSCGAGEMVRLARAWGLRAIGLDFSLVISRVASDNAGEGITVGDAERLPFPSGSFDFVTNIGSLEHLIDPAAGAREMARMLKPGGTAALLLPNTYGLMTTVWDAFRKGVTAADNQPIQRYGARLDWQNLLEANGLRVRRTIKFDRARPRSTADLVYYLRRPKDLVRLLLSPLVPLNLANCFVYLCERA